MLRADRYLILLAAGWSVEQIVRLRRIGCELPDEQAEAERDATNRWRKGRQEMCYWVWLAMEFDRGRFDETPIRWAA